MKIKYLGPMGLVVLASGTRLPRGEPVTVDDEVGKELTVSRPEEFVEVVTKTKKGVADA